MQALQGGKHASKSSSPEEADRAGDVDSALVGDLSTKAGEQRADLGLVVATDLTHRHECIIWE